MAVINSRIDNTRRDTIILLLAGWAADAVSTRGVRENENRWDPVGEFPWEWERKCRWGGE